MDKIDLMYLTAQSRLRNFLEGEQGESNIIAIVIVLGIVVALAIAFGNNLKIMFEAWWGKIGKAQEFDFTTG